MSPTDVPGGPEDRPLAPPERRGGPWHYVWFGIGGVVLVFLILLGWSYSRLMLAAGPLEVKSEMVVARVFDTGIPPADDAMWAPTLVFPAGIYDQLAELISAAGPPKRVEPAVCRVTMAFGINVANGMAAACYVPVVYKKTDGHISVHWSLVGGEWKVSGLWLIYDNISALGELKSQNLPPNPTP